MRGIIVLIGTFAFLASCSPVSNTEVVEINEYYNLLGLLDEQAALLAGQKATLEKTLGVGAEVEFISSTPNIEE